VFTRSRGYRFDPLTRDGKSTVSSADLSTLQVIAPRRAERVQPVGLRQWGALLHFYIESFHAEINQRLQG
jgi:hypothetical protein